MLRCASILLLLAAVLLSGCMRSAKDVSQEKSWSTVWHAGKALEMGASVPHIAAGLKNLSDKNAESQGFEIDKKGLDQDQTLQGEP